MNKAMIADIEHASTHDGYGIRTVVFFKGCPLHCAWCHNPECISAVPQTLYYREKCINCGKCEQGCFAEARVVCGREMTAKMIAEEVLRDKMYYGARGGVTFSGGEPLAQKSVLAETIEILRKENIGCAVETSMFYFDEKIFSQLDFVMADIKIWDNTLHKKYTGTGNWKVLENFRKLDALNIPMIVRTPVIPEIAQDIPQIAAFVKTLKNAVQYELLPYHPLGNGKRAALGLPSDGFTAPDAEYMKEWNKYAYIR